MTDDAPKPDENPAQQPSPEVLKARAAAKAKLNQIRGAAGKNPDKMSTSDIVMGSVIVTTITGVVLAIAIPGMCSSTRGARYSVRLEWERRNAEIDAIAEQARRDGKLPPEPEKKPRE